MDHQNKERQEKIAEFMLSPESAALLGDNRVQSKFCRKSIHHEITSDFTLPDYLPEIKKMLHVRARTTPPSRYIGADSVEFTGRVDYDLLYAASDGTLQAVPLGTDFQYEVSLDVPPQIEWDETLIATSDIDIDTLHCRVTAPRKVNIKCRLHADVKAYGMESLTQATNRPDGAEELTEDLSCLTVTRAMGEVLEIGDEVVTGKPIRPISGEGIVCLEEVIPGENTVTCRGHLKLNVLYEEGDGTSDEETDENADTPRCIGTLERILPFSQTIDLEGAHPQCQVRAWGTPGAVRMTADEAALQLDTDLILEAELYENRPVSVVKDLFSTKGPVSVSYRDFPYETAVCAGVRDITLSGSVPAADLSAPLSGDILACSGTATAGNCRMEDGVCVISGTCRLWVLAGRTDDYTSAELTVPLSLTPDVPPDCVPQGSARACVTSCHCRVEGDRIAYEATVSLSFQVADARMATLVQDVTPLPPDASVPCGLTVCYPEKQQRLWDIAKQYGVSPRTLAETNNLASARSEDTLPADLPFLLIFPHA